MFNRFKKIRTFIGEEVFSLYIKAIIVGFFWFAIEASFIFILQGFLVSLGIMQSSQAMLPDWYPRSLLSTSLILVIYGIARAIIILYRNYLSGATGQIFNRYIRGRFLTFGLNNVQTIPAHEIISVFNERTQQASAVLQYFIFFIINLVSLGFFFLLGLKLAPIELLIGISLLAIFLFPFQKLNKTITQSGHELVKEWNSVSQTLITGFKNFFFLKFYNLIDAEVSKGNKSLRYYEKHYLNYHWLASLKLAFPVFLGSLVVSLITFLSFRYWHTPGATLLSFYYVFIRLAQGASDSSTVLSIVKLNLPGFKILFDWHDRMEKFEKSNLVKLETQKILPINEKITLKLINISYSYKTGEQILKDLNLDVLPADILLIKGESGAGKSTLVSLVAGFNKPDTGEIIVNGQKLDSIQESLLLSTGYVGPEPFLIAGTVKENLLYGFHGNASDESLWSALEIAQIKKEVLALPQGLNENLNEFTQLSTGQKQRLSLARAFVRQPKLLILDEATANLDPVTENAFIQELLKKSLEMTTIIISHKNTFDDIATQSLVLKKL